MQSSGRRCWFDGSATGVWALAYVLLSVGTVSLIFLRPPTDRLADLHVYWGAARQVLAGAPLYSFTAENGDPFTYPPFAMVAFLPLGCLPEAVVMVAWTAATLAAVVPLARLSGGIQVFALTAGDTAYAQLKVYDEHGRFLGDAGSKLRSG